MSVCLFKQCLENFFSQCPFLVVCFVEGGGRVSWKISWFGNFDLCVNYYPTDNWWTWHGRGSGSSIQWMDGVPVGESLWPSVIPWKPWDETGISWMGWNCPPKGSIYLVSSFFFFFSWTFFLSCFFFFLTLIFFLGLFFLSFFFFLK